MIHFTMKQTGITEEWLGFIPEFLSEDDPRPAVEQLDANYQHGGGWRPISRFTITPDGLHYPGDPPFELLAEGKLRDETIRVYDASFVAVIQPDGSYEVARMD